MSNWFSEYKENTKPVEVQIWSVATLFQKKWWLVISCIGMVYFHRKLDVPTWKAWRCQSYKRWSSVPVKPVLGLFSGWLEGGLEEGYERWGMREEEGWVWREKRYEGRGRRREGGECERSRRKGYQHHQLYYHPRFMVIAVLVICTVVYMPYVLPEESKECWRRCSASRVCVAYKSSYWSLFM